MNIFLCDVWHDKAAPRQSPSDCFVVHSSDVACQFVFFTNITNVILSLVVFGAMD